MNVAIINCFDTYEQRVDLLHDFFLKRGDCVRIYTSDFRHFEKRKRDDRKNSFIYIKTIPYHKNISFQRLLSHAIFSKDVFKRVKLQNIDLMWVLIPPNSLVKKMARYKKNMPGVKLVFDVIDMWPETMPIQGGEKIPIIRAWKNLRNKWINVADYVVTECNLYQNILSLFVDKRKMSTIYLARDIKPFTSLPNLPKDKISLCYLGSINNIIDIATIKTIIESLIKKKNVILHIIGDGEKREELISESKKSGAEVVFHGKIFDKNEKQRIFDSCHFGLNIMKESVYVGLTMKSIDYFEAGLPIINNIHGDTWKLVKTNNIGFNIDDLSHNLNYSYEMRCDVRKFYEINFSRDMFEKKADRILDYLI